MTPKRRNPFHLSEFPGRRTSTCLLGLLLGLTSAPAHAQDETDPDWAVYELDEFQVIGIRESLTRGIELKRDSYQMIDAIVAEDIGKFPDNNVVEALQRVPGIQTTDRARGEVSTVTIRGFNDVTTTVNGRNIFTASERSVALADIPASLLYRVDVFKTRAASQIEHGIAGVIDIKTQRPFYFNEERTVIAARGIYSELPDKLDPNISGLYTNTWETQHGRFGFLVNASYARTNWTEKSITSGAMVPFITENPPAGFTWGPLERIFAGHGSVVENPIWQPGLESGLPFGPGSTLPMTPVGGGATVQVPYYLARDAVFTADFYGKRERPAVNVSLQWEPNSNATYTFEAFYNGYREDWQNNLMFAFADPWWALGPNPASTFELYPGTNIIKSRTTGAQAQFMSGDKTVQSTDSYLYALSGEWKIGDNLELTADLSYQTSKFDSEFQAVQTNEVGTPTHNITVDFNDGKGRPGWAIGDNPDTAGLNESDLTDPRLWNVGPFFDNAARNEGEAIEFQLNGNYRLDQMGFLEGIQFGVRLDTRDAAESDWVADREAGFLGVIDQPLANFPQWQRINRGYYDGRANIPHEAVLIDADYLHRNADEFRQIVGYLTPSLRPIFDIKEETVSGYVLANFQQEFGRQTLRGQFGVRYVNVDRNLSFWNRETNQFEHASTGGDHFLPSLDLIYDLNENVRLRASYGETLRYPGFGALNPIINYVPDVTNIGYGTASGGNVNLAPTESKNYDVGIEYYFGQSSHVYATAFKRKIDGLVVDFRNRVIYQDYPYILSQPDNASNGELDGFEFGLIYFPDYLPGWAHGLGIQASYTILDSSQDIPVTNDAGEVVGTDTTPFFAVSDSSYSVVLAYEKPRYSVRVSYVWREDFLNNYEAAQFANPIGVYHTPEKSLDLQLSVRLSDNWTITFDATNLTDEEFHSYYADPSQSHDFRQTHNFGNWLISRTFAVGTRFSF